MGVANLQEQLMEEREQARAATERLHAAVEKLAQELALVRADAGAPHSEPREESASASASERDQDQLLRDRVRNILTMADDDVESARPVAKPQCEGADKHEALEEFLTEWKKEKEKMER